MAEFFKNFGKGVLYIFVLPVLIVILAFYGIIGLFAFIIMTFKSLILFFTGRSLHDDLPEDKKVKEILAQKASITNININTTPVVQTPVAIKEQPTQQSEITIQQDSTPKIETEQTENIETINQALETPKVDNRGIETKPDVENNPTIKVEEEKPQQSHKDFQRIATSDISTNKYTPLKSDNFFSNLKEPTIKSLEDDDEDEGVTFGSF